MRTHGITQISFAERRAPWYGLGTDTSGKGSAETVLQQAGLDWNVIQRPIRTDEGDSIPLKGYYANIRESDGKPLGIVRDRYQVVQNREAFSFIDSLAGEGVTFLQAGSFQGGKKVWILSRLPEDYPLIDNKVSPYIIFINSHDGTGSIKAAMTPVRVICQNMLNLALRNSVRCWSANHTGNIEGKLTDARNTLLYADHYMKELQREMEALRKIILTDTMAEELLDKLLPMEDGASEIQLRNRKAQREEFWYRYQEAPDLKDLGRNGYRFLNAVSDFATHSEPLRRRENYQENLFQRTVDGLPLIDRAYALLKAA